MNPLGVVLEPLATVAAELAGREEPEAGQIGRILLAILMAVSSGDMALLTELDAVASGGAKD